MADAGLDRRGQLVVRLAHAAEHDALGIESRRQRAGQLATRHDVRARAEIAENPEHRQVRVGLHRIGDPVRYRRESFVERAKLPPDYVGVVDVGRRARPVGDRGERDSAEIERRSAPLEAGVGEESSRVRLHPLAAGWARGQYALAHTASVTLGRPHHMQVAGTVGERNSSSGSTRMVALVCSLISASHSLAAAEAGVDESAGRLELGEELFLGGAPDAVGLPARARRFEHLALHRVHGRGDQRRRRARRAAGSPSCRPCAAPARRCRPRRRGGRSPAGAGRPGPPTRSTWRRASSRPGRPRAPGSPRATSSLRGPRRRSRARWPAPSSLR